MEHTGKRAETKKEILSSWSDLIILLDIYLQQARRGGGTMGHKVGYYKNEQIRLMKVFDENL